MKSKLVLAVLLVLFCLATILSAEEGANFIITSSPAKIEININNQRYFTPVETFLKPGEYPLSGSAANHQPYKKTVTIPSNGLVRLFITLDRKKAALIEVLPTEAKIKNLPFKKSRFWVDWDYFSNKYLVVPILGPLIPEYVNGRWLLPSPSPKTQIRESWSRYQDYGHDALDWLQEQNIDPKQSNIAWYGRHLWPKGVNDPLLTWQNPTEDEY